MALFCAYTLVLFGGVNLSSLFDDGLRPLGPAWYWPVGALNAWHWRAFSPSFCFSPWPVCASLDLLVGIGDSPWGGTLRFYHGFFRPIRVIILPIFSYRLPRCSPWWGCSHRYRHVSTFQEREQTKWAALDSPGDHWVRGELPPGACLLSDANGEIRGLQYSGERMLSDVFLLLIPSRLLSPFCSQLYDIDVIINRRRHGSLTGILAALDAAHRWLREPGWPVHALHFSAHSPAISTLVIAALFVPARQRIKR